MKTRFTKLLINITILILLGNNFSFGQTTHLSLSDTLACPGSDFSIQLHVTDLYNAGAITLYIGYDSTLVEYQGHSNAHPQVPGLISNAVSSPATQVNIIWNSTTAANINSGVLVELNFTYIGGICPLTFNSGGEITSINLAPIPFTTSDGSVSLAPPYLYEDPQHVVITAGNNAVFSVLAADVSLYQWQGSDGVEWYDLENNETYQNVNGSQLTIVQASVEMDSLWYRCFLKNDQACELYSDSAMLNVLPELTAMLVIEPVSSCPEEAVEVPFIGYALYDVIEFAFYVAYLPEIATFESLTNIQPLIEGVSAEVFQNPVPHIRIIWSATNGVNIPDGKLFDLVFNFDQGNCPLVLMENSFVLNESLFSYNLALINGLISTSPFPVINIQPSNTTVLSGEPAVFSITATDAVNYQWYESTDNTSTWIELQNAPPYNGVNTPALTISPALPYMDNYFYRCEAIGAYCQIFSNAAKLSVDTLTSISQVSYQRAFSISILEITGSYLVVEIDSPVTGTGTISLYDLNGRLITQNRFTAQSAGKHQQVIKLSPRSKEFMLIHALLQGENNVTLKASQKIFLTD